MTLDTDIDREIDRRRAREEPFAVATVVRTLASTSARPGNKALLDDQGAIVVGFLGGGCARAAIGRAARDAIRTGAPQFVSLKPGDLLEAQGVTAGEEREGVRYARNGCPSAGSMDIFVEPVLPRPKLVICGQSSVARALAEMSGRFGFKRVLCPTASPQDAFPTVEQIAEDLADATVWDGAPYVVVATQGQRDEAALRQAVAQPTRYVAFVGSRRKFARLAARLAESGTPQAGIDRIHAPAGLNIDAITPDEIALSILAQIVQLRRRSMRDGDAGKG